MFSSILLSILCGAIAATCITFLGEVPKGVRFKGWLPSFALFSIVFTILFFIDGSLYEW